MLSFFLTFCIQHSLRELQKLQVLSYLMCNNLKAIFQANSEAIDPLLFELTSDLTPTELTDHAQLSAQSSIDSSDSFHNFTSGTCSTSTIASLSSQTGISLSDTSQSSEAKEDTSIDLNDYW